MGGRRENGSDGKNGRDGKTLMNFGKFHIPDDGFNTKGQRVKGGKGLIFFFFDPLTL